MFIVYSKDRPVSPFTARVTIMTPVFFTIYGIRGGGGLDRYLSRLVHHPSGKGRGG